VSAADALPTLDLLPAAPAPPRPLTERIVRSLPGAPAAWRALWGIVPLLQAAAAAPLMSAHGTNPFGWSLLLVAVPVNLVLSFCIVHALWATERMTHAAQALRPGLDRLTPGSADGDPFAGTTLAWPPFALTLLLTLVLAVDTAPSAAAPLVAAKAAFDLAIYLPIVTWAWTFLCLTTGLRRVGQEQLGIDAYAGDRSLGLSPVGRLASTAFGAFVANLVPILLLNVGYVVGLAVGLTFFVAGVAAFFVSLHGLHRQMRAVKRRQAERARELYAAAYAPLRLSPTLETLQRQAPLLGAAEALERRADTIQSWPFTNAILTRIVVIASSVFTAIVTRLVLKTVGL
jgi:hypothetical protein